MRIPKIKIVEELVKEPAPATLPGRITARDKVCSMTELQGIVARYRATGQRVALCHGVFDLVHLGHVRHLEEARGFGDVLVVTLTADAFVNKGPGRPVFAEFQRAEMLAALDYVDHVAINNGPDAEQVIRALQPDFYVKGSDYANADQDVTGKIAVERAAVEAGGGKLVFTDDITFSSSELINRHLDVFDTETRDYLSSVRAEGGLPAIMELLDRIKDYRVLLVGDAIVDEYQYASPMAKAPKENIIATRFHDSELFAGGVFAAANHVASFCKEVEVVTWLGARDSQEELIRKALKPNVKLTTLVRQGAPTTRKVRFVDPTHLRKLFEVYFINDTPLAADDQSSFDRLVAKRARDFDVVIATDFGHGAIARSTVNALTALGAVPGRQRADQQRQYRLQPGHQVPARGLCLHRRARGQACDRRQVRRPERHHFRRPAPAGRLRPDHHHRRQARLRHLRGRAPAQEHPGFRQVGRRHGRRRRCVPRRHGAAGRAPAPR